jgi:hypothetical protein
LLRKESFDMILNNNPSFYDGGVTTASSSSMALQAVISSLVVMRHPLPTTNPILSFAITHG